MKIIQKFVFRNIAGKWKTQVEHLFIYNIGAKHWIKWSIKEFCILFQKIYLLKLCVSTYPRY